MSKTNNSPEMSRINLIGEGTSIIGDVKSEGDIRIDGYLKGTLNTKGKVVVGTTGTLLGELNCRNSDILGKVQGKITVTELLSLKSTAKIEGEITTNKLSIEPNAIFTGTCNMNVTTPTTSDVRSREEKKSKPEEVVR